MCDKCNKIREENKDTDGVKLFCLDCMNKELNNYLSNRNNIFGNKTTIVKKTVITGNDKIIIIKAMKGDISLREAGKEIGCSHEQVRNYINNIFKIGFKEGWVTINFTKI